MQCRDRRAENKHVISNSNVVNNINECDSMSPYLPLSVGNNIGDLHDQIPIETVSIWRLPLQNYEVGLPTSRFAVREAKSESQIHVQLSFRASFSCQCSRNSPKLRFSRPFSCSSFCNMDPWKSFPKVRSNLKGSSTLQTLWPLLPQKQVFLDIDHNGFGNPKRPFIANRASQ